MKDLEKNNLEDFEIPEQFYNNLMPNEKILYKFKSIKSSIFDKLYIPIIIGMIIFYVIMEIVSIIRRGYSTLFSSYSLLMYLFFFPLMFFMFFFMRKKMKFTREYYVVITDKRIFTLQSMHQLEFMDLIELNKIKLITFRKRKQSEKIGEVGIIDIFSEAIKPEKSHRTSIKGVQNLMLTLDIIESILYHYGNVQERLDSIKSEINTPHEFKLDHEVWEKINKSYRISSIITVISIIATIIGLIFTIYGFFIIDSFTVYYLIFVFIFSSGATGLLVSPRRKYDLNKILTSDKNCYLRLNKKEIFLLNEYPSLSIPFNQNLYLNLYCTYYSTKKDTPKFVGGIIIKESYETLEKIKFGPIFEYLDLTELIFLNIINWKSQTGYLKTKERLLKSIREVPKSIPYMKKKDKIETSLITEKAEDFYFEPYDQSDEIFKPFINYLNLNEKILLTYKPKIIITKYIFIIILGILCTILFFNIFFLLVNIPFVLAMPILTFIILGMGIGMVFICFLPGVIMMKNSVFIFTDQKIMAKYSKRYIITPYSNISSIMKRDRKKKYNIEIYLKSEIESSPFIEKNKIFIQKVPKGNDLLLKIKKIKDNALLSK